MATEPWSKSGRGEQSLGDVVARIRRISAENERLVEELAAGEHRFRHLAKAVWRIEEDERRSIALELHDGIGQVLTALINHLRHTPEDTAGAVTLAQSALDEVRRMSRALRPSVLDDLGLVAALTWLARTSAEASGLDVRLDAPESCPPLDPETETVVFRVVQEALNNAVKHAGATRVRVTVQCRRSELRVTVADDGHGFDADARVAAGDSGFGLRGMRDRAELFGGRLDIRSAPGDGSAIVLTLPATGH